MTLAVGPTRPRDPTKDASAAVTAGRVGPTRPRDPTSARLRAEVGRAWGLLGYEVAFKAGNAGKLAGVEAGSADQDTVNIALGHDGTHVVGLD